MPGGSHGSLTKAGKVRFKHLGDKIVRRRVKSSRRSGRRGWGRDKVDNTKPIERNYIPKKIPRVRYRRMFTKRILKGLRAGQPNAN